ncbi:MAG: hypothetical protein IJ093_00535 [Bacilli bacterium]|nr:hypothetical protein [Bacilli bacterium]
MEKQAIPDNREFRAVLVYVDDRDNLFLDKFTLSALLGEKIPMEIYENGKVRYENVGPKIPEEYVEFGEYYLVSRQQLDFLEKEYMQKYPSVVLGEDFIEIESPLFEYKNEKINDTYIYDDKLKKNEAVKFSSDLFDDKDVISSKLDGFDNVDNDYKDGFPDYNDDIKTK